MKGISQSASKLVLLGLIGALVILTVTAGIWDIVHGQFGDASKEILDAFKASLGFVMGYYFGRGTPTTGADTPS